MPSDYHWEARRKARVAERKAYCEQLKREKEEEEAAQRAKEAEETKVESQKSTEEIKEEARRRHLSSYSAKLPHRYNNKNYLQQW